MRLQLQPRAHVPEAQVPAERALLWRISGRRVIPGDTRHRAAPSRAPAHALLSKFLLPRAAPEWCLDHGGAVSVGWIEEYGGREGWVGGWMGGRRKERKEGSVEEGRKEAGTLCWVNYPQHSPTTSSPLAHLLFLSSPNKKNNKKSCFITTMQFPVGDTASRPCKCRAGSRR